MPINCKWCDLSVNDYAGAYMSERASERETAHIEVSSNILLCGYIHSNENDNLNVGIFEKVD